MIIKVRLRRAGTDHQQVNPLFLKLHSQHLAQSLQGEFAGAIFVHSRDTTVPQNGCDVDDDRPVALSQHRQGFTNHLDGGEKVDLHNLPQAFRLTIGETSESGDACIVDQRIQAPPAADRLLDRSLTCLGRGDIARDDFQGPAGICGGLDFILQRLKFGLITSDGNAVAALPDQFARDRASNPAGRPRHDRPQPLDLSFGQRESPLPCCSRLGRRTGGRESLFPLPRHPLPILSSPARWEKRLPARWTSSTGRQAAPSAAIPSANSGSLSPLPLTS